MGKTDDFFEFKELITPMVIKILYVIGIFGMFMLGVVTMIFGRSGALLNILFGLLIMVFGNLFWRMTCEGIILLYSMHDRLVAIEGKPKKKKKR